MHTYKQTNNYGDDRQDSIVIYKPETIQELAIAGCHDFKFDSWWNK